MFLSHFIDFLQIFFFKYLTCGDEFFENVHLVFLFPLALESSKRKL